MLSDIKSAVETAIKDGHSFEHFKKDLQPTLIKKGWWGRKKMTDPLTGEEVDAQLGSDRRLKTIYDTNLRSAYQKAQYDRTMESDLHPYLMYRVGNSARHREQHLAWDGLILPKDAPSKCGLHKRVLKAHICLAVRPSFVNKTRCVVLREFPHLSANTIYCEFCGEQNLVRAGSLLRLPSCILCRPQIFRRK